ncbi:MAG: class I SAM-dependent methyltransferase [Verrucomicrobiota bacterium JB022]|nr:class I SAM-dependent methyltransferase [Verrucomicrobiota bacterium JB022]
MADKSSVEQIRARFDGDVERFSNLETGQVAALDGRLMLETITAAARGCIPQARGVLDLGCGAGNYSLMLQQAYGRELDFHLVDLSQPMLDRAQERLREAGAGELHLHQSDLRTLDLPEGEVDIIVAAAVLHHLREEHEWQEVFASLYRWLRPGGWLFISDLVTHDDPQIDAQQWDAYGRYLEGLKGPAYREQVFAYIAQEDSPRSLAFQLRLMEQVGFTSCEVLHKHAVFAAFGGRKG